MQRRSWGLALAALAGWCVAGQTQENCPSEGTVTGRPAERLASTAQLAVGRNGALDGGVTDLAFRAAADGGPRVWATDPSYPAEFLPFEPYEGFFSDFTGITSFSADLRRKDPLLVPDLGVGISGIAEVPNGPNAGMIYALDPGLETIDNPTPRTTPRLGIIDPQAQLVVDFAPITGDMDPGAVLTALDVHPDGDEFVVLDANNGEFFFLDSSFAVVRGPFPIQIQPIFLYRSGVCYNTCDTVLIVASVRNNFESFLALEYDRQSGQYTGRGITLENIVPAGSAPTAVGIEMGNNGTADVLYVYNLGDDTIHTVALEYTTMPGLITGIACPPDGSGLGGSVPIGWAFDPATDFDSTVILQNGVDILSVPPDQTDVVLPGEFSGGYSEFTVELRKGATPTALRFSCIYSDGVRPGFANNPPDFDYDAIVFPFSPANGMRYAAGMDVSADQGPIEDVEIYWLTNTLPLSNTDGVRVLQFARRPEGYEPTIPRGFTLQAAGEVGGFMGLALVKNGEETEMALLGLNVDGEPAAAIYRLDGSLVQSISPIDFSALADGSANSLLTDWDNDAEGRLVTMDYAKNRLVLIEHDRENGVMRAVADAPVPLCAVVDCANPNNVFSGGVTVLPNGLYLVSGGDSFDGTITRALLATPFDSDPAKSVKFVGYTAGIQALNVYLSPRELGPGVGPDFGIGLSAGHWSFQDSAGELGEEDIAFYTIPGFQPLDTDARIAHSIGSSAHPDYRAEQLLDGRFTAAQSTGALRPSFASRAETVAFFYTIANRGSGPVELTYEVAVGGAVDAALSEVLRIPPGRFVNRQLFDRQGKDIEILLNRITGAPPGEVQLLVGARAKVGGVVNPTRYVRGDCNGDGNTNGVGDAILMLTANFIGGVVIPCRAACDVNDDGNTNGVGDAILLLTVNFIGGVTIPAPFPACGTFTSARDTALGCATPPARCQ